MEKVVVNARPPQIVYDTVDALNKTGYLSVYPVFSASGAQIFAVTNSNISSTEEVRYIYCDTATGAVPNLTITYAKVLSADIDLPFNISQNVEGNVYFDIPLGAVNTSSTNNFFVQTSCALYKVNSAGTETLINTKNIEVNMDIQTQNVAVAHNAFFPINTSGALHFNIGETLRLRLNLLAKTGLGTDTGHISYGINPSNSAWSYWTLVYPASGPTRQTWLLPIKLDT